MTVTNNAVRAKIEVEGIKSHQQRIPVVITTVFLVDEIVSGIDSTAFAKVAIQANPGDTYIVIKQRTRFFNFEEDLVGGIAGLGTSNGSMTTGDELYTNPTYGIDAGLWTLETTGNMIASIDDSVMKINIDQGGNLATGYQFGFKLANFGLVDAIEGDGLFLKHLPTRYYIDFGAGYTQVWSGIIDTFPKTGDTTADFKCTDASKTNTEKVGSEDVPIAFNLNYNCKLPLKTDVTLGGSKNNSSLYKITKYESNGTLYHLNFAPVKENWSATNPGNPTGLSAIEMYDTFNATANIRQIIKEGAYARYIIAKQAAEYKIVDYKEIDGRKFLIMPRFIEDDFGHLDNGNDNEDIDDSASNHPTIEIYSRTETYTVSKNDATIHEIDDKTHKTPTLTDGDEQFSIYNTSQTEVLNQDLIIKGLNEDRELKVNPLVGLNIPSVDIYDNVIPELIAGDANSGTTSVISAKFQTFEIGAEERKKIIEYKGDDDLFAYITPIRFPNVLTDVGASVTSHPLLNQFLITSTIQESGNGISNQVIIKNKTRWTLNVIKEGLDVILDPVGTLEWDQSILQMENIYESDIYTNFEMRLMLWAQIEEGFIVPNYDTSQVTGGEWFVAKSIKPKLDNLSAGCTGENVQPGNEFENYPNTIEYLQETYLGIPSANISDASYDQAQTDYDLFASTTERNPAHQIIAQTDSNTILKDMLKSSHLGLYLDRVGQYRLENWLPKSTVFSDSTPISDYTDQNWLPKNGISKISRSEITQVVADFQLDYDFNESTGEFQQADGENKNAMRIKNTHLSVFDFDACTEGVSVENTEIATQAWELLHAGYLRAKKETQTTLQSKWIKMSFSDGTGESEAINFIRNQAGHVNRELEKVTIRLPLNATDAIINLLSFISVTDQKRTNGETRPGWIIDHRISWKSKEIIFKILLDISQFDPFLVQINIIQDNPNVTDIIQIDATATSIIQNGTGK
jgi:hypothetical protein